jgi:hypothetical protein
MEMQPEEIIPWVLTADTNKAVSKYLKQLLNNKQKNPK